MLYQSQKVMAYCLLYAAFFRKKLEGLDAVKTYTNAYEIVPLRIHRT